MKRKRSLPSWTKGDTLFIALVLGVIVSTSWVLQKAFDQTSGTGTTQAIGTIIFKQKVAERKFSSQALWGRVESKAPVFNFDTIRTGPGASAVVNLQDGTEIHLDEETMVGLELQEKAFSVALVTGKVAAKRPAGIASTAFSITSKNVGVTMENGEVTLARQGEGVSLQTTALVTVTSGGQTSLVQADQAALIAPGAAPVVQKQPVSLVEPADQAYAVGGDVQPVVFRWQTPADSPGTGTLQISRDSGFSSVERQLKTNQGQAKADLPEGSYSWRVLAPDGTPSASRRLVVFRAAAPTLAEPQGVQSVADPASALVPFSWSKTPDASSYRLEIFEASRRDTPYRSLTTTLSAVSVPGLPEGRYVWRVVGLYPFANAELPSVVGAFSVEKLQKLQAPGFLAGSSTAVSETKAQFSALAADSVLGWESVPSAETYEVVIAKDPEFKQVVSTTRTTSNSLHRPTDLDSGDYYWRVRALTQDLASDPSAAREFSVVASLPLVALSPRSVVGAGDLPLAWSDPNHGQRYRVEVSAAVDFADPAVSVELPAVGNPSGAGRSGSLAWDKPGAFFWKVSLLGSGGQVLAASPAQSFVVPGGLTPPPLLAPSAGAVVDVNAVPAVTFRWGAVPRANLYRWALFRTLAGKPQPVYRTETTETSLTFDRWDLLTVDPYVWRVTAAAVDQGRDVEVSRDAVGAFSLTQVQRLKAAVPRVPPIVYLPPEGP